MKINVNISNRKVGVSEAGEVRQVSIATGRFIRGRGVEMRFHNGVFQWRPKGDAVWRDLASLDDRISDAMKEALERIEPIIKEGSSLEESLEELRSLGDGYRDLVSVATTLKGLVDEWDPSADVDADTWGGHAFGEYLDQPVRTSDDVEFRSVKVGESVTSEGYKPGGFDGSGFGITRDEDGNTLLEIDRIVARGDVKINNLFINQVAHVGGRTIYSAANMECVSVIDLGSSYRCFMDTKSGTRGNLFRVDDQAFCMRYDPNNTTVVKYYWRLVVGVGADWIDLSKTDKDGTGIPAVGDNIVHMGNRTDVARQAMLEIDQLHGGMVIQYAGIRSFDLKNKEKIGFGYDAMTGRAKLFCFGDFYVGTREMNDENSRYITFQIPEGGTSEEMYIRANVELGNDSKGLSNLTEFIEQNRKIESVQKVLAEVADGLSSTVEQVGSLKNFTDSAFSDGIVDRAEAAAIEKYRNAIQETKQGADAAYAEVYAATPDGSAKSNLLAAKGVFDTATSDLLASVAMAAYDGVATEEEKKAVDDKYALFNEAWRTLTRRLDEARSYALAAVNTVAQGAWQLSKELQKTLDLINDTILPDLQNQIDGSIVSHSGEEVPTLANEPAVSWTTDEERARHVGDYYDRKIVVEGKTTYERYRFNRDGAAYKWGLITDSGAAEAIAAAREALGVADSKAKVFFGNATPHVPYSVDDLWFKLDGTILISNADRIVGATASPSDWQVINDTALRLRQMASDDVISKEEKSQLRNDLEQKRAAMSSYEADAAKYGVSAELLRAAFTALANFLTGAIAVEQDTDTALTDTMRSEYNALYADYHAAVSRFANAIADKKAGDAVDGLHVGGVNMLDGSYTGKGWTGISRKGDGVFERDNSSAAENFIYSPYCLDMEAGKEYVVSFFARNTANVTSVEVFLLLEDWGDDAKVSSVPKSEEWTYHSFVFTPKVAGVRRLRFDNNGSSDGAVSTIYIKKVQVEEGNKATAWKESPADIQAAIDAAQAAADAAQETLAAMNDDGVLDIAEKQALRTQWELISGMARTDLAMESASPTNGSYYKTRDAAKAAGVNYDTLVQAVGTLRSKLNGYGLYTDSNTPNFDRAGLAALFTAYYAAEIDATKRTADAIAQGKVDNIQVGGVNLLLGTRDAYRFLDSAREGVTVTSAIAGGFRETTVKPSGIADVDLAYGSSWAKLSSFPVAGRTYTFSLEYRTNAPAASFRLSLRDPIMAVDRPLPDTGGEWRRIWWRETWNVTTQTKILLVLDVNSIDTSRYVAVRRMKLEEGDVATAWTAAPEETTAVYAENLALKSNLRIETANYAIGNYYLAEELSYNTDYTVTVWGELGAGKSAFGVYTGGGYQPGVDLKKIGEGVYSGILSIGTTIGGDGRRDRIQLYARPGSVTGVVSTVERVKLERGVNLRPSWTPASSEMLGADAVTYEVEPSVLVVGLGEGGVLAPSLVTFRSWTRTGAAAKRTAYAGRLAIAESTDGESYTTRYTSAADEASHAYTISGSAVRFVRCSLYAAGGVTSLLDQQTVTVVPEAGVILDRLNDDAVFEVWEKRTMRAEWYTISGKRTASSPAGQGLYIDAMNKFGEEAVVKAVGSYYDWLDAYFVAFDLWTDTDTRVDAEGKAFSKEALQRMLDLFYRGLQQLTYTLTDSFGYLKDAFGDMTTQQTAGVVLTGFSGVKNTAGAVVAGMAGKNFLTGAEFAPDDESCPIFFAGAESLLQANEAKTRIYPSGLLETSYIKATGGTIGDLRIDGLYLISSHQEDHGCKLGETLFRSWAGNNYMEFSAIPSLYNSDTYTYFRSLIQADITVPNHRAMQVLMHRVGEDNTCELVAFYTDNGIIRSQFGDIEAYYGDLVSVRGNIRGRHIPRSAKASGASIYIDSGYRIDETIMLSEAVTTVYLPNPNYSDTTIEFGEFYELVSMKSSNISVRLRPAGTSLSLISPTGASVTNYNMPAYSRCKALWDGTVWRLFI